MCNKMSDVRLSNASPTVERVDARQPDSVRPSVRRNLFGTPDREEIRRYLETSMQGDVEAFEEQYNFDPVNERPLTPRNYVWQEDRDAPEFYRREPHGRQRPQTEVVDSPESRLEGEEEAEEERGERRSAPQPDRGASRKRNSADSGPCCGAQRSKRLHTDDDDDEDPSGAAGSQALTVAAAAAEEEEEEDRPSRPEERAGRPEEDRPSRPQDCAEVP